MARVAADRIPIARPSVWTVDSLLPYSGSQDLGAAGVDNPAYYDSESGLCSKLSVGTANQKKPTWQSLREAPLPRTIEKRQCNGRLVLLIVAVLFLLLVIVATLATVVYLAVGEQRLGWADDLQAAEDGISIVEGHLRITNRVYTPDLSIPNSQAYLRLSSQVKQSMDAVFLQSGLAPYYNETGVLEFRKGSVVVKCQVHLTKPRVDGTHQVGMAVVQALERQHGYLPGGLLQVDIRSLHFTGLQDNVQAIATLSTADAKQLPASWGPWSEWTSCVEPCEIQTRSRQCLDQQGVELVDNASCGFGHLTEVRNCPCTTTAAAVDIEESVVEADNPANHECGDCESHQICLLLAQTATARCLVPRDAEDPTGCGGWCVGEHELCRQLNNSTFQCVDNSECLPHEWQCSNGLCIPYGGRCDGQFDCYDMSDEFKCECKPGEFQCGNNTSCLPRSLLCNGQVDCWDGSDELNCTLLCPASQYTCNTGRCVDKLHFCDGFPDCDDGSDEPEGCSAPCLHTQHQCRNGRCVNTLLWCNGVDNCGDRSDELACDPPQLLEG